MKLGIGTAQFGMHYGVTNTHGKCQDAEVRQILQQAALAGVDTIDTAIAYGDSEQVLGKALTVLSNFPFQLVTKLPAQCLAEEVVVLAKQSLERLKQPKIYACLVHHVDSLLGLGGEKFWQALLQLKAEGLVEKIGVSVYAAEHIEQVLEKYPIEIIQLPLNLFDQHLWRNGQLKQLKQAGVEIHVRSVFLQGVILTQASKLPPHLMGLAEKLNALQDFCKQHQMTPLQAALAFVWHIPEVDRLIVGASSLSDFQQVLHASQCLPKALDFSEFIVYDKSLIDPTRWQM